MAVADMKKYFTKQADGSVIFKGNRLDLYIPAAYESHGGLRYVEEDVSILAVCEMVIDETIKIGYFLPALITLESPEVTHKTINEDQYIVLTLTTGDVFMKSCKVVRDSKLVYVMFLLFIDLGKRLNWMTYDTVPFMFDEIQRITGVNLRTNHAIFEMMFAHLARDPMNPTIPWRLTDWSTEPNVVPLRFAANSALSVSARVIGSYFNDSVNSALVNPSDIKSTIEDYMRA